MDDSSISHGVDADCLAFGAVFADRYRIERRLGEGSRKWTYLARDALLDERPVALSVTKDSDQNEVFCCSRQMTA